MTRPLVSRPPYGGGHPRTPRAEAKLPGGGPTDRGIPLDDSVPGYSTFNKPEEDKGTSEPRKDDESIYRVDGPRDLPKSQDRIDVVDQTDARPHYMGLGQPSDSSKTKYPYRDGKPNSHNASVEYVTGLWLLGPEQALRIEQGAKVAAPSPVLTQGLNPKIVQKAQSCQVVVKRADIGNLRWIFAVDCGNGAKVVRVRADRTGNATQFAKLNLHVACSCPAWRWQGPEYHSTTKDYQDPNTALQGTASTPDIRDPNRVNKVCKHVAAVISFTRNWAVPNKKK